ncbi:MAG: type II secretion system secretin GspD, partial [Sphingomonadaceae bacterium]|nr:type II secretion system secretin GspD [Sphingomonadaceae bacterium]
AALVLALLAAPLMAQTTLNLRDADIRAFIQDASRVTGRTFVIDGRVAGKVSVVTERPLSKSEYFEVFLSTLRANGLVAVPIANGAFRIQPADTAAQQPGRIGVAGAARNSFVTEIVRLRSADAAAAVDTLRPLVSREGSITANKAANSLVIADYADNVRRVRALIRSIDTDTGALRIVPLRNAGARDIAASLATLAGTGSGVAIVPIDSSNSIALRGDSAAVAHFAAMIGDLDRRASAGNEIRVIYLQHADAEKLVPVLQQLVGQAVAASSSAAPPANAATLLPNQAGQPSLLSQQSAPSATASTPAAASGGSGRAVIARYEGANAIIIAGPADLQRTLGEVVRQLDTRRDQVLVEAIVVEISDTAARKLGVQFLLGSTDGSLPIAVTNYSNATPNILTIAGAIGARQLNSTTTTVNGTTTVTTSGSSSADSLAQAAISSILGASGAFLGYGARIGDHGVFGTIINAVSQDNKSNILSTPSIVTLDNQEAKILVGQEIPVTTGQALSNNFDNAFRTVQRQNVGVQLEVKPQIGEGGAIKLYIRQEVSSIAGPVSSNDSDLILNKREIQTTVTVDDGQIIALGGLLDDNERRTIEKIPLLGDIPVLGELFRSRSRSHDKTNLMVFIRPTILRSPADAQAVAAQRYNFIRDQQLAQHPKEEPSIEELVRDYLGTTPPVAPATPVAVAPAEPQVIHPEVRSSTTIVRPVELPPSRRRKP